MIHAAHAHAPREGVLGLMAGFARRLSHGQLSVIAGLSGVAALVAAATGFASGYVLASCYVTWSFASWGILFHDSNPRGGLGRLLEFVIVASASVVFGVLVTSAFFWTLGPRWML